MKKLSTLFAAVALTLVATFSASAAVDNAFKVAYDKVTVTVNDLAPNADFTALVTCYDVDVAADALDECATLVITPVVKNGDHKKVVEIIVVNGESRKVNTEWLQSVCYGVCDPNSVRFFTLKDGEDLHVKTCKQIDYEDWMDDGAKFYVTTQKATYKPNCIYNYPGEEYICDVPYLTDPLVVDPVVVPVEAKGALSDSKVLRVKLYYPCNVTKKVDNYLENEQALALLNTLDKGSFEVLSVDIEGWASPEATVPYNQNLSNNRAKTVKNILAEKYNFDQNVYSVKGNGEYWDSVIDYVANSAEPIIAENRAALQNAIESNGDLDKREAAIKKIAGGKAYRNIFDAVYPRSRFAEAIVTYKIKEFDKKDMMAIYAEDPENITAEEYLLLIENGANEEVINKAIELYPNNKDICKVAAQKAYNDGDVDSAIKYYKKAGDTPEVNNNLACCYLLKGDIDNAKTCLEKSADTKVAETNANELRKVVLNQKYFNK